MSDERTGETRRCPHHAEPVADCVTCYFAASSPPVEADADLWGRAKEWRVKAAQHKKHGDTYRIGQGWGMEDCADELESLLRARRAKE